MLKSIIYIYRAVPLDITTKIEHLCLFLIHLLIVIRLLSKSINSTYISGVIFSWATL